GNNSFGTILGSYNLSSDQSIAFTGTGNKTNDPFLRALANNGGPTKTMALATNSPARDNADPASCGGRDQRGAQTSGAGTNCDIGSYEYGVRPTIDSQTVDLPVVDNAVTLTNGGSANFSASVIGDQPLNIQRWINDT